MPRPEQLLVRSGEPPLPAPTAALEARSLRGFEDDPRGVPACGAAVLAAAAAHLPARVVSASRSAAHSPWYELPFVEATMNDAQHEEEKSSCESKLDDLFERRPHDVLDVHT